MDTHARTLSLSLSSPPDIRPREQVQAAAEYHRSAAKSRVAASTASTLSASTTAPPEQLGGIAWPEDPGAALRGAIAPSVDVYDLVVGLCADGELTPSDFFSPFFASCLAPFLERMGAGAFNLGCGPMAGAATILLNSPDLESLPASRIVDVEKLFDGLLPLLKYTRTLQSAGTSSKSKASGGRPSLVSLMSTAKRALKDAVRNAEGAAKLPSAVSLLLSSASSHDAALQYAAKSQVLLVQSECDVASLDVEQALAPMVLTKLLSNVLRAVAAAPLPM